MTGNGKTQTADVAVIGCGIVGLSIAWQLRQRGLSCVLIDAKGPAGQVSFGNAGAISIGNVLPQSTPGITMKALKMLVDPTGPFSLDWAATPTWLRWLLQFVHDGRASNMAPVVDAITALNSGARAPWLQLAEAIGAQSLIGHTGYLHVYSDPATFAGAAWARALMREREVAFDELDAKQVRALEPKLGEGFAHGVFQRESLSMRDPGAFCGRLFDHLVAGGAQPLIAQVEGIVRQGKAYRVETARGAVHVGRVVVAAGAFSNALLAPFGVQLPMIPARGYHLMYPQQPDVVYRPTLWVERYMVISPMQAGLRMTSIKELTALERPPRFELIERLDGQARLLFPTLKGAAQGRWSGDRPCTPDSLPLIGQLPGEQLWIATGHGHMGLTQGPVTGQLVAQAMSGETPSIDLVPYRIGRFRDALPQAA
ncbi:D-amino-acid dehydrogenase [Pseudoxanthomonas sp. GM95]|uniref:NAD(P)/FAD-dependent oxidoreductase n=1 Tax=Pseudoxanthomonas sp. GM95 TaxID=1881043 RepID=UPI0008BAB798|nr:FAD-binding oxidoreductase [Pseudoxanthomonas sp. GM95]SEK40237.1 D-amino-acid dehydrogenase [Pseudoxanthomonas sp. GM95]